MHSFLNNDCFYWILLKNVELSETVWLGIVFSICAWFTKLEVSGVADKSSHLYRTSLVEKMIYYMDKNRTFFCRKADSCPYWPSGISINHFKSSCIRLTVLLAVSFNKPIIKQYQNLAINASASFRESYTSRTWIMRHPLTNNFTDSLQ